ncbi:MAG: hypothetical protein ABFC12_03540, partial [Methanobacterium sp.]
MTDTNNNRSPNKVYIDEIFKLSDFDENYEFHVPVRKYYEFFLYSEMMDKKLNIVFYEPNPICPQCGSEVRNNGRRIRDINRNFAVKIQKYVCKNEKCNYYFET